MEDVIFNCPHCEQELQADDTMIGTEIECPSCHQNLTIPEGRPVTRPESSGEEATGATDEVDPTIHLSKSPTATSAAAKMEHHFKVPQREKAEEKLIEKPLATLEKSATQGVQIRIKTFRRSDCVEVGKDLFDEVVSKFLGNIGEPNIIGVHPINYSHQDLSSRDWVTDFGVIIIYKK